MPDIERYITINIDKWKTGYWPNKNLISDLPPMDAIIGGSNLEVTEKLTLKKRPGVSKFSTNSSITTDHTVNRIWQYTESSNYFGLVHIKQNNTTDSRLYKYPVFGSTRTQIQIFGQTSKLSVLQVGSRYYVGSSGTSENVRINSDAEGARAAGTAVSWGIPAPANAPTTPQAAGDHPAGPPNEIRFRIGVQYGYTYRDSLSGHESSLSPLSNPSIKEGTYKQFERVYMTQSPAAVTRPDKIRLYRTEDGGSTLYYVTEIANTPGGGATSYDDVASDEELDHTKLAPIANQNDPPPSGINDIAFHAGFVFIAAGNTVYYNIGDDVLVGIAEECFPPLNKWTFKETIYALASSPQGLLCFAQDNTYLIRGTSKEEFFPFLVRARYGVVSQDCVAQDGGVLFLYTANKQLIKIDIDGSVTDLGLPVNFSFNPPDVYLEVHKVGIDTALYLTASSLCYKYDLGLDIWSPARALTSITIAAIASIQTAATAYDLVFGPQALDASFLWYFDITNFRDLTATFADNIQLFLTLAPPGELVKLDSFILKYIGTTTPTLHVLVQDYSGTHRQLTAIADPPTHANQGTVLKSKRYNFNSIQVQASGLVEYCSIQIAHPAANEDFELLSLGVRFAPLDR